MVAQPGLKWESAFMGAEPKWTHEPQIEVVEKIVRQHLDASKDADALSVEFFGGGAFNKLYTVRCAKGSYMMRVSLPVDPICKTLSEVATLAFVRANTDIPVPQVIAFDASQKNELGFEWILMELMPGMSYNARWKSLSLAKKEDMVRKLAHYSAQLFRLKFSGIGNIYHKGDNSSSPGQRTVGRIPRTAEEGTTEETIFNWLTRYVTQLFRLKMSNTENFHGNKNHSLPAEQFTIGRIVSLPFFYKDRLNYDVPRGPFASDRGWLAAHLSLAHLESDAVLSNPPEEDPNDKYAGCAVEEAGRVKGFVDRLSMRLQWLFPQTQPTENANVPPETTVLLHDDINEHNILVDDEGNMAALVDWENVSTMPLWRACQFPKFLEGRDRDQEPDQEEYGEPLEENGLYWQDLREYEQTHLRRVFLEEMERLEPSWIAIHRQSAIKQDFDDSIQMSYNGWSYARIHRWLDDVDAGKEGARLSDQWVYKHPLLAEYGLE